MTTHERINQVASDALHFLPQVCQVPKPASYMSSFERLKTAEFAAAPATPAGRLQIGVALNAFDAAFAGAGFQG